MAGEVKNSALRRSVYIPAELVAQINAVVGPGEFSKFNQLVISALRDFVANRKRRAFERAVAHMAEDADIRRECETIAREFAAFERDGLK